MKGLKMEEPEYSWYLDVADYESSAYYKNMFTPEECETLIQLIDHDKLHKGTIEGNDVDDIRDSDIYFLPSNKLEFDWVFRRCVDIVLNCNERFFQFDLHRIQNLQYTVYEVGQKYGKHIDMLYRSSSQDVRKLSFSVQLSDPADYEGGDLLLHHGDEPYVCTKEQGSISLFPGYILHEVTPVTKGTRRSLVGWVTGPRWC